MGWKINSIVFVCLVILINPASAFVLDDFEDNDIFRNWNSPAGNINWGPGSGSYTDSYINLYESSNPVHSGYYSMSVQRTGGGSPYLWIRDWEDAGISNSDLTKYAHLTMWVHDNDGSKSEFTLVHNSNIAYNQRAYTTGNNWSRLVFGFGPDYIFSNNEIHVVAGGPSSTETFFVDDVVLTNCTCSIGPCCDGCNFKDATTVCKENITREYSCPWGNNLGNDVGVKQNFRYCSGTSSNCNGFIGWGDWQVQDNCTTDEICRESYPSCTDPSYTCYLNRECGTDSWINQSFCKDSNVYQDMHSYKCNNSGTASSFCSNKIQTTLKERCLHGCYNNSCIISNKPPYLFSDQYSLLEDIFKQHLNYFLSNKPTTTYGLPLTAYKVGDRARYGYSNPTEWGYLLQAWIAAAEYGIITKAQAESKIKTALTTMNALQNNPNQNYFGLFYPYYKVTDSAGNDIFPYHDSDTKIPSIDNGLLYTSLLIVEGWSYENNFSNLANLSKSIKNRMNYNIFLFDSNTKISHQINASNNQLNTNNYWDIYPDEGGLMAFIMYISNAVDLQGYEILINNQRREQREWNGNVVNEAALFNSMFTWSVRSLAGFKVTDTPYSKDSFVPSVNSHLEYGDFLNIDYPGFSDAMTQTYKSKSLTGIYFPPNLDNVVPSTPPSHILPHAFFVPFNVLADLNQTTISSLINKIKPLMSDSENYYRNTGTYNFGFTVTASPYINDSTFTGTDDGENVFETLSHSYIALSLFNALQNNNNSDDFYDLAVNVPGYKEKVTNALNFLYPGWNVCVDDDGDKFNVTGDDCGPVDCNDNNPNIYPGVTELCNGLDDDCDGVADEGLGSTTCGIGMCRRTVNNCINGTTQTCIPFPPSVELCNGLDDDCDGNIDEGLTQTCGSGSCLGTKTCSAGVWNNCSSQGNDAGICARCNATGVPVYDSTQNTDCNDALYCNGVEACFAIYTCKPGIAINCSSKNLAMIATCNNNPDNNPFTRDYFAGFTSTCNEVNDKCNNGTINLTHTCNLTCGAGCVSNNDCNDNNSFTDDTCLMNCTCYHEYNSSCVVPYNDMQIVNITTFCNGTYNLTSGIDVIADNIVLDCNGAVLNGLGAGHNGIDMYYRKNVTVKNCIIKNYHLGIELNHCNDTTIMSNNVSNNYHGIYLEFSRNNIIMSNYLHLNIGDGIRIWDSNENIILNNYASNNSEGILLAYSNNNSLIYNIAYLNSAGIYLVASNNNRVESNDVYSNVGNGIYIGNSNNNKLKFNKVSNNQYGFLISSSYQNEISINKICGNIDYDINNIGNNSGINNTCDIVHDWNDTGAVGCTKHCTECIDNDGDKFNVTGRHCGPVDCDDSNPLIYPGATENCTNNLDDDCDNRTDDDDFDCMNECITPYTNISITRSVVFCGGYYNVYNITIAKNDIVVDCNNSALGSGWGRGIVFNVIEKENITIKNCRINPSALGISLKNSSDNFISNISCYGTNYCMELAADSNKNKISNIHVYKTFDSSLIISNSNNNIINYNDLGNSEYGASVYLSKSHNNIIKNNNMSYNGYSGTWYFKGGVALFNSDNNTILNNTITNNKWNGHGFYLSNSKDNLIHNNNVINNSEGFYLWSSINNIIYRNNIENNTIQAYDSPNTSFWDYNEKGNYWSNYDEKSEGCFDLNKDKICDNPYIIDNDSQDNYPFAKSQGIVYTFISTCTNLQNMKNDLTASYMLQNDINCYETKTWNNGKGFEPIGNLSNKFTGSFNGQNYKIKNLYINRGNEDNIGLFGAVNSTNEIKGVGLENFYITGKNYVGSLIGSLIKGFTNEIYTKDANIQGYGNYIGGLIGKNENGIVKNTFTTGTVAGKYYVGGESGFNNGTIENSYSTSDVKGTGFYGGLIGYNYNKGIIKNSFSTGKAPGFVSLNTGNIINSYGYNYSKCVNINYGSSDCIIKNKSYFYSKNNQPMTDWDFVNIWKETTNNFVILKNLCKSKVCSELGKECGAVNDGCEKMIDCGTCSSGTCVNGKCFQKCSDSDGGNNIYVKGTTTGYDTNGNLITREDSCSSRLNRVIEYYCSTTGDEKVIAALPFRCPNGCGVGACVL